MGISCPPGLSGDPERARRRLLFCGLLPVIALLVAGCADSSSSDVKDLSDPASAPVISLTADPPSISANDFTDLNWSVTNAASCEASGAWSGRKALSDSETVGPLTQTSKFTLVCNGPGGSAAQSVTVTVTAAPPPPAITNFTPTSGPVDTTVTITGANFSGTTAVAFNRKVTSFTVDADTRIFATVPSGATTGGITVTTGAGTDTSGADFTVTTAPPGTKAGDNDGDGMADAWELAIGFDPSDGPDAGRDTDGDGFSNLEEFQAGTDPHDATDGKPPPQSVLRGPYLQQGTPTSVIIKWRTDHPTTSGIYYGTAADALTADTASDTVTTEHELLISNLQPDTRYYYKVGNFYSALVSSGSAYPFSTAPTPGTPKPTRIWVIGDSGTANDNARAVRDAYKGYTGARGTDLWLMLGDNAYGDGTDGQYQDAVFDMYPELLRQTPLWSTLGNHDGHTASSDTQTGPYYDIFTLPTNAEAGGLASGTEAYYSFDYANVHFICLNSYDIDRSPNGAMMTWLQNDLAATDRQWVIAFWHHPPYSKGSHDSDSESALRDMRENALPILESFDADLVLSGHSHSYERSLLIDGHYGRSDTLTAAMIRDGGDGRETSDGAYDKPGVAGIPNQGAIYAVAGSSGKNSGGPLNHPAMFISLNTLGSMVLDVTGNRLDAIFLDDAGSVQDQFTIIKGP
jgi:hypothetical protein